VRAGTPGVARRAEIEADLRDVCAGNTPVVPPLLERIAMLIRRPNPHYTVRVRCAHCEGSGYEDDPLKRYVDPPLCMACRGAKYIEVQRTDIPVVTLNFYEVQSALQAFADWNRHEENCDDCTFGPCNTGRPLRQEAIRLTEIALAKNAGGQP
jgi:hypothetical protein